MKAFVFLVFTFLSSLNIFAQQNTLTWDEKQPLSWFDFAGEVNDTSLYDAESFAEVKYCYWYTYPGNIVFKVFAHFNKKTSWCKKDYRSEALLRHEQTHFDIAELYARKLKQAFESFRYSGDYQNEILAIFNEKKQEYHRVQQQYDEETHHSVAVEKQKQWENLVHDGLHVLKPGIGYAKNK